jgi:ABC-type nitrate/sulfonate/bicarbonate transport system substrate-binding protein
MRLLVALDVVRIGFLPLVDAAVPILAREFGFAEEEGLDLVLVRDLSWATVLDRLVYGHNDAAHMIAPLAIATSLGLGRPAHALSVPFVLGLNGNAVTLNPDLAGKVMTPGEPGDAIAIGRRLAIAALAAKAGGRKLRFGVVHRFSSHNYMLRYWLRGSGLDPNEDVEIVTVSPPFAADALASGEVDGICVGEPWNSVAVDRGVGAIAVVTAQIWRRGVEKVLAIPTHAMEDNPERTERLLRALYRAGIAFVDPARQDEIVRILSGPAYIDAPEEPVRRAVSDRILFARHQEPHHVPDFMFQHREAANFPWSSQAAWLYAQMCLAGHTRFDTENYATAQRTFRPDVYRKALRGIGADLPGASAKLEGAITDPTGVGTTEGRLILGADSFFDGARFDPAKLGDTLADRA